MLFVDTETTGLNPRNGAECRIVTLSDGTYSEAFDVWDDLGRAGAYEWLYVAHEDTFVAQNAQFDLDFLYETFPTLNPWKGPIFDTMVAWQVLHAGERVDKKTKEGYKQVRVPASLAYICERLLGVTLDKQYQKARWDGYVDSEMLKYAAKDVEVLIPLHRELSAALKHAKLDKIFKMEMQLLPLLLESKRVGIYVDREAAVDLIVKDRHEAKKLEGNLPDITEKVGVHVEESPEPLFYVPATAVSERLNARSPGQVATYFNLEDAQEDTLRWHVLETEDEIAQTVMDIKKKLKRASSVEKQILTRIAEDGRIHPSFHQCFTDTGRLSSREPNLQNQDRGKEVRSLFRPARGKKFVIADYSQLELRLAAYYSGDETMIEAYANGRDLHTETQERIFGNPDEMDAETKKKTRTLSKNINFGLVYGGGYGVLQRFAFKSGIILADEEAIRYRHAFRKAYPRLIEWQSREGDTRKNYVYTYLGRRRYIQPGVGFNARINNKIQGTAADGMKLAMVYLYREHGILPLVNVHDEVIIECSVKDAERVLAVAVDTMQTAMYRATGMDIHNPAVPIGVEAQIVDTWAEKA